MEPSSGISSRNRPRRLISGSLHTVDAVLAGYYEDEATGTIDSLLFGLYAKDGLLHFVGQLCRSAIAAAGSRAGTDHR